MTISGRWSRYILATSACWVRLYSLLEKVVTFAPASSSCRTRGVPRKPLPPVTVTRFRDHQVLTKRFTPSPLPNALPALPPHWWRMIAHRFELPAAAKISLGSQVKPLNAPLGQGASPSASSRDD